MHEVPAGQFDHVLLRIDPGPTEQGDWLVWEINSSS
jgi:hypothetical protein